MLLMYVGINILLATSLNLVNGYMGEFSLAHAGMAVGAYTSVLLTMHVLPPAHAVLFRSRCSRVARRRVDGVAVALPSFKVRGDYLAIITLAFLMIVKSRSEHRRDRRPRGIPASRD
jgi:branched-chain amino acid transport system permease protein